MTSGASTGPSVLVGIFVGGRATRMGGRPKGLLPAPDTGEPLVSRLARITREAVPSAGIVLVGENDAYASLGLRSLPDAPAGSGPAGGLLALLLEARRLGIPAVVALACDLPHVTTGMVTDLVAAARDAAAVAPRSGDVWEPLFARYAVEATLPVLQALLARGRRSLQAVFEGHGEEAAALALSAEDGSRLVDWDEPGDVSDDVGRRG